MRLYSIELEELGGGDEVVGRLGVSRGEVVGLVGGLDDEAFVRKESGDEWSVAEVLEHLGIVENSVARTLRALRLAHTAGRPMRTVAVPQGRLRDDGRAIAPEFVTPKGEMTREMVMEALAEARKSLLEQASESRDYLDREESFPHPFFGELNAIGWLRMAAFHEANHIKQLQRIIDGQRG